MGKGRNGLPDRWEIYKPVVNHVAGTRFLPFKVPLKEEILIRVPNKSEWFTPALLCEMKPELKAIIDLTDTFRYYNPEEFTSRGISYKKINITGRGKIPSRDKLREFYNAVDEFTNALPEDALIGVHCTHGLNRTGYLICKYMVTRMEIDPEEAITRFEKARGHKIERENLISNIKDKSGKTDEKSVQRRRQDCPRDEPYSRPYSRERPYSRPNESNWRSEPRAEPTGRDHSRRSPVSTSSNYSRSRNSHPRNYQRDSHYENQGGSSRSPLDRCYDDDHQRSNNRSRWNR